MEMKRGKEVRYLGRASVCLVSWARRKPQLWENYSQEGIHLQTSRQATQQIHSESVRANNLKDQVDIQSDRLHIGTMTRQYAT